MSKFGFNSILFVCQDLNVNLHIIPDFVIESKKNPDKTVGVLKINAPNKSGL